MVRFTALDFTSAMRSAGVSSAWLGSLSSSRLSNIVHVTSDQIIALNAPSVFYLDRKNPQLADGIVQYSMAPNAVRFHVSEGLAESAGSGSWAVGTLPTSIRTTGTRETSHLETFNTYFCVKPLTIASVPAPPRTGLLQTVFRTHTEYSTLQTQNNNLTAALKACTDFRDTLAARLSVPSTYSRVVTAVDAAIARANAPSRVRVVFSRAMRPIRFGGY